MSELLAWASDIFTIVDIVVWTRPYYIKLGIVSNVLQITQSVNCSVKSCIATNSLNLVDQANISRPLYASNQLWITQSIRPKSVLQEVTQFLFLQQSVSTNPPLQVSNILHLQQSVSTSIGFGNQFVISQTVTVQCSQVKLMSSILGLQQGVSIYKQNDPDFVLGIPVA